MALRMRRPYEAERLAIQVLRSNRGNVLAAQVLGEALLLQNRPEEAIGPLQRCAKRSPDPATETLLAMALNAAGRRGEALDQLRQATERRPPFALAFLEMGDRLGEIGRFEEGVALLERGLALMPAAVALQVALGHLHLKRNDRSSSRRVFQQARETAPERYDVQVSLAKAMVLDGEYAAAAELYRRALAIHPDDSMTRISFGKCLLEMGDRGAGEAALREAAQCTGQFTGLAILALAETTHGRFFLRPSDVARFLQVEMS